ncbi:TaqI-like C-terminal specificity domain-containing protein [Bacteroides heparinolyticus]|uniref:TaqI-like C-terminal specificity domain-containing protein n=1 Tax=Prevotella heparinolytica TaxID=28113 RepID=UPI00359F830F
MEIYRGVLTGCNDAFIITSEKRDEILANCTTKEERTKTAEIIRPILRGRDIRKYGYEWADLWIINTHNGIKGELERIHIEDYPAIKQHLDNYWDKMKPRADQGDTVYNLRNCAYLDEFSKPKIVYPNMTKFLPFVYDTSGVVTNQKCFIITGKHLGYLTAFLNSSLFKYCFADRFPELQGKTRELSKIFMGEIPILEVNDSDEYIINRLMLDIQIEYSVDKAKRIDKFIFDLYHLSSEEQAHIGFIDYGEK